MLWRGAARPRILRSGRKLSYLERQVTNSAPLRQALGSAQDPSSSPKKKIPVARHSDLLATAGTEDDVTGIELKIAGLVRSVRKQGKISFAHISDGSTLQPVQAILSADLARDITNGSYVELIGKWTQSPKKGQAHELQATAVDRVGVTNADDFPIQKQSLGADFLRTVPHLRVRTPLHSLLTRARSRLIRHVSDYYTYTRLTTAYQVHPPLITSSDCEGAGEVFTITPKSNTPLPGTTDQSGSTQQQQQQQRLYFREPKYLTVSSQLHLEAYSAELGDVWALSPTFRAEESETPRHLSEFYMLEAEFRSVTSLTSLMREAEDLTRFLIASFQADDVGRDLVSYHSDPKYQSEDPDQPKVDLIDRWRRIEPRWTTITYTDAISALQSRSATTTFQFTPSWSSGLQLEHERWLVENVGNGSPVFVTDYPKHQKPFYMLPSDMASDVSCNADININTDSVPPNPNGETVSSFDLLFPHGTAELVGGSLREHRLPNLISTMREKGLVRHRPSPSSSSSSSPQPTYPHLEPNETLGTLQWYADLRRYGSSPHGGFGMGFDRLLAYLTGTSSVRDTVGYPRWFGRADC